jgi:hypothetical protein
MTPAMRFIAVVALSLLVGACTQYALVQPQQPVTVKGSLIVEPDIAWNRINQNDISGRNQTEVWTADGPLLNSIVFFAGIEDGKPLFVRSAEQERKDKLPEFRSSMTPTDVMELLESTVAKISQSSLTKTRNLQPEKFAGKDGFRFELTYVGQDEVDRDGIAVGTIHQGRLYMIFYDGARLHHFGLRRAQAERIIQTARLPGPGA